VAWQNVGYNQPTQPGVYLGHDMKAAPRPNIRTKW
jgi:rhamnogalacturonan endolyase